MELNKNQKMLAWWCNILTFIMFTVMSTRPDIGFGVNLLACISYAIYGYWTKQWGFFWFQFYYIPISIYGIYNLGDKF